MEHVSPLEKTIRGVLLALILIFLGGAISSVSSY